MAKSVMSVPVSVEAHRRGIEALDVLGFLVALTTVPRLAGGTVVLCGAMVTLGVHGVNTTTAYPFEEFCQLSQECVRDLIEYGQKSLTHWRNRVAWTEMCYALVKGQFFYYQTLNKCIYVDACEARRYVPVPLALKRRLEFKTES
eukprot:scaffold808_cov370-Prasinococcus_capsulatus_cf.AAC.19